MTKKCLALTTLWLKYIYKTIESGPIKGLYLGSNLLDVFYTIFWVRRHRNWFAHTCGVERFIFSIKSIRPRVCERFIESEGCEGSAQCALFSFSFPLSYGGAPLIAILTRRQQYARNNGLHTINVHTYTAELSFYATRSRGYDRGQSKQHWSALNKSLRSSGFWKSIYTQHEQQNREAMVVYILLEKRELCDLCLDQTASITHTRVLAHLIDWTPAGLEAYRENALLS